MRHDFLAELVKVIKRLIHVVEAHSLNRVAEPGALVLPGLEVRAGIKDSVRDEIEQQL